MRRILLFLLLLPSLLQAQNLYLIDYTGQTGNKHSALVFYKNDLDIIVRHYHHSSGDLYIDHYGSTEMEDVRSKGTNLSAAEKAVRKMIGDVELTVWATEDGLAPVYVWSWDTKLPEEEQMLPYVSFVLDDVTQRRSEKWVRADKFTTINLTDVTDEMLDRFFDKKDASDCAIREKVRAASNQALENTIEDENKEVSLVQNDDRPTLHLFELTNTTISDIGNQCSLDNKAMHKEMRNIATVLDINIKEYDVTGEEFGFNKLKATLKQMKVKSDDIIIFHYSGHGFRFDDQEDPFPQLSLCATGYEDLLDGNYVALSDIYEVLQMKKARLCIVLSDCCNSLVGIKRPIAQSSTLSRDVTNYDKEQLNRLFLQAQGSLLSTAASPGEVSWCDMQGGMFTNAFLQALRGEISLLNKEEASWDNIIENTITQANNKSKQLAKAQNGLRKSAILKK